LGGENLPENYLKEVVYSKQLESQVKCYEGTYEKVKK
jgi:hypothetical protein